MSEHWGDKAACRSIYPETFFPPGRVDSVNRQKQVQVAVAVCTPCKVRRECADDAIRRNAAHGVVAGVDLGDNSSSHSLTPECERALRAVADGVA
ncbi:WhiB family transcriptional regulator [Nocardia sp. NBC_00565]|uniref:WhiB family transcriptional regulator n=1 Tax=Nocardia sp. NBC_00565 TaxID=2975993 RepID=UPI003FA53376